LLLDVADEGVQTHPQPLIGREVVTHIDLGQ